MLAYIYKNRTNFKAIDVGRILLMETQQANAEHCYLERSAGVDMSVYSLVVPVIAVVTAQCFEVVCRGPGDNV